MTPTAVAGGSTFAFAAGLGGAVYAWGDDLHGQLADGRIGPPSPVPVKVSLPDGVSALSVAAGDSSAYVIGSDGKLYDWGNNKSGQLGIGSTKSRYRPGTVQLPDGARPYAIAAGKFSAYAIGSNGVLYSWGQNEAGQLGNNSLSPIPSTTPVRVALPSGVTPVKIAAGQSDAYALASNGTVYAWGDNHVGQLGNSTVKEYGSPVPVPVLLPSGVTPAAVDSGLNSGYVLTKDGLGYAWGANGEGSWATARGTTGCSRCAFRCPPVSSPSSSRREPSPPMPWARRGSCTPGATTSSASSATAPRKASWCRLSSRCPPGSQPRLWCRNPGRPAPT
jgi:hypothetical protein